MTHVRNRCRAGATLATVIATGRSVASASVRTFDFDSPGSMVRLRFSPVGRPRWPAVDISAQRHADDHRVEQPTSNE